MYIIRIIFINISGWLESVGSCVLYELDYKKPILYVIPIESILGKLPVAPVGDTGTIPHILRNHFPGAPGDCRPGSGDGCRMCIRCGLSTLGHWDGLAICNESEERWMHSATWSATWRGSAIISIISIGMKWLKKIKIKYCHKNNWYKIHRKDIMHII